MKDHIHISIETLQEENVSDGRMRYKCLKFEIRKFSIFFSISKIKEHTGVRIFLENKNKRFLKKI